MRREFIPLSLRAPLLAVLAGVLLYLSFPPYPLWFLAPVGVALLVVALQMVDRLRAGFGIGFLAGLAFFLPLLPWTGVYVGPGPWIALSVACAVYYGLFGLVSRLVLPLRGWPVWIAACWSLAEFGRSSFPFGGFPWGRLAFGQADGWLLPLAALGGAPLLSFAVALIGALAVYLFQRPSRSAAIVAVAALFAPFLLAALAVVIRPAPTGRTITVAAIQGSVPRLGLDFNAQRRAVLDNHLRETDKLAAAVRAGTVKHPNVVVWPENSSDIDPFRNPDAYELISDEARNIDAPILVGAVLVNDNRTTSNTVIVWDPQNGPQERHDKKIIQPFGEYMPFRSFFALFSDYADKAGYFVPGDGDGVVHAHGIAVGIATCYEVVFDRAFEQSVDNGAELLAVPTNNATFGDTDMTYQQLAMSRVRAVEHDRAVVVAATSGVSAVIASNGDVMTRSELFDPATLIADVPLNTHVTLASRLGPTVELLLCAIAIGATISGTAQRRHALRG
ncbi:MAG: apolipoprotein N-acyltransferase [Nocardiaceae bacterium]|nr:apolipoprotein N-acyltransferase [Nocardiaceae bacterium]